MVYFLTTQPGLSDHFTLNNWDIKYWVNALVSSTLMESEGRRNCIRPYCEGSDCILWHQWGKDLVVIRDKQQDQNMVPHFPLHQKEISRLCLLFHALIPGQLFSHAVLSKAENESGHPEVTWFYPLTCWKAFPQALWVFSNDVRKNIFCICFVLFLRASG